MSHPYSAAMPRILQGTPISPHLRLFGKITDLVAVVWHLLWILFLLRLLPLILLLLLSFLLVAGLLSAYLGRATQRSGSRPLQFLLLFRLLL